MGTIIGIVLPVFGVILTGYLVARTRLFDEAAVRGLSNFVFWVAIPALLFRTLARGAVDQGADFSIAYAYFLACGIHFLIALALGRWALRRDGAEAALMAMGAVFSNTVMLGIPLVLTAFGEEGVAAIMLIIAFHSTILIPMATIAVEIARGSKGGGMRGLTAILPKTLGSLIRNPVVVALAAGLVWSLSGQPLPDLLDRFLDLLGRGAVPCALFALGATMTGYRIAGDLKDSAAIVALKLGVHPLIVWLVATQIFALSPLHTAVATIVAALPVGVNVFILARAYDTYVRRSASAVLISTVLSVLTTGLVLARFATSG